jgi:CRISPR/Cas system CMR-associated protein Cmr1 (group 7 of RAMP superfamily)
LRNQAKGDELISGKVDCNRIHQEEWMESLRLTCEVVTPLFGGGADQQPEIRLPSIRGGVRFWFRALMSGV